MSEVRVHRDVAVPMRDGTNLATDVYIGPSGSNVRRPALVVRTPYDKTGALGGDGAAKLAALGYVVVVQDLRGRFASEGTFTLFENDPADGCDTIEWVAGQPWCDGHVGMWGISYMGHATMAAAMVAPPHLEAAVSLQPATDMFTEERLVDGVFLTMSGRWNEMAGLDVVDKLADPAARAAALADLELLRAPEDPGYLTLPITDVPYQRHLPGLWGDVLAHRDDPAFFTNTTTAETVRNIAIPMLHVGSWFDPFLRNTLRHHRLAVAGAATDHARDAQRLIVGPWPHAGFAADAFGALCFPDAPLSAEDLVGGWHDHWLRGAAEPSWFEHRVLVYVLGANRWRAAETWPPPEA
ncbi:MAG: uncharacterized protein V7636_1623, partial [Actinomycetota bacterium]